ncbi:MAG: M67 family metallopeptidase [Actinomycetes bacterium]
MLRLTSTVADRMIAHCLLGLPDEACGLLAGHEGTGDVDELYPADNLATSALVYTVDPKAHLKADRDAEHQGRVIIGVFHSHTHTEAYPSPTDVAQAPDPEWHYVIVSLRDEAPAIRSYRIVEGQILEEPVEILSGAV